MDSKELLEVVSDGASEARPQISPEEYKELVGLRQKTLELKAQKSDVQDFVIVADHYAQQLPAAREQLQTLANQINETMGALQARLKDLVEPHGVTGEFSIADTEPHYINVVQPPQDTPEEGADTPT